MSYLEEGLANSLAIEENQVDTVIINNLDVRGNLPSIGTLSTDLFEGMSMAQNIFILDSLPLSGIKYEDIEIMTFNLGGGIDSITVESTSEAIHDLNLGGGNDGVIVKSLSGPMLIKGDEGDDTVLVSSNEQQLRLIKALLAFDGGDESNSDTLTLDNSNDLEIDDYLIVTRLMVQVESMDVPNLNVTNKMNPILPRDSYLINLQNSTGGSFTLLVNDAAKEVSKVALSIVVGTLCVVKDTDWYISHDILFTSLRIITANSKFVFLTESERTINIFTTINICTTLLTTLLTAI